MSGPAPVAEHFIHACAVKSYRSITGGFSIASPTCAHGRGMKSKHVLIAGLLCAIGAPSLAQMPPAGAWEIGPDVRGTNYSVGMPDHPSPAPHGALTMEFPLQGMGEVDALTTAIEPLAGAQQITLRYRVDAAPGTRFVAVETPREPATVSLYFQQAGDNWSARGRFASYRWYSTGRGVIPLGPGEHTVTLRLDEIWTNVNGQPNDREPQGFANALRNSSRIGLAFGSASRRSHGVFATGQARFTLLALDID
jgi:hypothetical protein